LKSTVERITPTRVKLKIEATTEDLKPSIDHAYEHIAEDVSIPGFRKGKVPPAILEKRVGKGAIMAHAINDGMDSFYRAGIEEHKLRPIGQPKADIISAPDENTWEGTLSLEIEVEVRPEIKLPEYKGLKVKVTDVKVDAKDVDAELDALRARFGTLKTVERPAKKGDFTSIDLKAEIDGKTIDEAKNISYEIGSGNLLDGIDEALDTLTAGESTTFKSKLVGGDAAGKESLISVTLNAVKERELPKADDEFAKLASEFDTVAELKKSLEEQLAESKKWGQGLEARDKVTDTLLGLVDIAISEELINDDVTRHLEGEGRLEDDKHRAEVKEQSEKSFRVQMLLDEIALAEDVKVNENELMQYLVQSSQQYGMEPGEFIKIIDQNGQIPSFVGEVARRKALAIVLEHADVSDSKGKVDLEAFTKTDAELAMDPHAGHDHD
jgi:trigger factor